jgi:hypothetical protein
VDLCDSGKRLEINISELSENWNKHAQYYVLLKTISVKIPWNVIVITTLTTTHKSDFYTQCDYDTYECNYDTHECGYDTHEGDLYTYELNFNTIRVTLTRTN